MLFLKIATLLVFFFRIHFYYFLLCVSVHVCLCEWVGINRGQNWPLDRSLRGGINGSSDPPSVGFRNKTRHQFSAFWLRSSVGTKLMSSERTVTAPKHLVFWDRVSYWDLKLAGSAKLGDQWVVGTLDPSPLLRLQAYATTPSFLHGFCRSNSEPLGHEADMLHVSPVLFIHLLLL